jgi:hypothetical protein
MIPLAIEQKVRYLWDQYQTIYPTKHEKEEPLTEVNYFHASPWTSEGYILKLTMQKKLKKKKKLTTKGPFT